MMTVHGVLIATAMICFLLAAIDVPAGNRVGWLGAFLAALAWLLP